MISCSFRFGLVIGIAINVAISVVPRSAQAAINWKRLCPFNFKTRPGNGSSGAELRVNPAFQDRLREGLNQELIASDGKIIKFQLKRVPARHSTRNGDPMTLTLHAENQLEALNGAEEFTVEYLRHSLGREHIHYEVETHLGDAVGLARGLRGFDIIATNKRNGTEWQPFVASAFIDETQGAGRSYKISITCGTHEKNEAALLSALLDLGLKP